MVKNFLIAITLLPWLLFVEINWVISGILLRFVAMPIIAYNVHVIKMAEELITAARKL